MKPIDQKIANSSFGTKRVTAARSTVPKEATHRTVERAKDLAKKDSRIRDQKG